VLKGFKESRSKTWISWLRNFLHFLKLKLQMISNNILNRMVLGTCLRIYANMWAHSSVKWAELSPNHYFDSVVV